MVMISKSCYCLQTKLIYAELPVPSIITNRYVSAILCELETHAMANIISVSNALFCILRSDSEQVSDVDYLPFRNKWFASIMPATSERICDQFVLKLIFPKGTERGQLTFKRLGKPMEATQSN